MKSFTVLLLAGLAAAAQEGGAQAAAGNATDIQQGNSTEAAQGADANAGQENNNNDNQNENNNEANAGDVIQVQNGQQCINVEALNDPKCVPHHSVNNMLRCIILTHFPTALTLHSLTCRT